jgi:protein phosphatase
MKQSPYRYESWAVSHEGRVRELNEDRFLMDPNLGLWVVADGMGGYDAGEVASTGIVEQLKTIGIPTSASDQHARFVDRLTQANHELQDYSQRNGGSILGSTVVALLIYEGAYRCLWVGDSRIYLLRQGELTQLSRDHSEVQELVEQGILSREEARTWKGRNVITRAVGVYPEIDIEAAYGDVEPGDTFLLCSDGLTAHASDDDILEAVTGRGAKAACEKLLELVLERGATDNVTIVITQIRGTAGTVQFDHAFAAGGE